MAIHVECQCGETFETDNSHAGRKARCSHCDAILTIPDPPFPTDHDQSEHESSFPSSQSEPVFNEQAYSRVRSVELAPKKMSARFAIFAGTVALGLVLAGAIAAKFASESMVIANNVQPAEYAGINDVECEIVAEKFTSAIEDGGERIFTYFDLGELGRLTTEGIDSPRHIREKFVAQLKRELRKGKIGTQLYSAMEGGGTCQIVNIGSEDEKKTALIRIHSSDFFNYVKLYFCRDQSGHVRIADMFFVSTGEDVSSSLRTFFVVSLAEQTGKSMDGWKGDLVRNLPQLRRLEALVESDPQRAIDIYKRLPPSVKRIGSVASNYATAAQLVGHDECEAALKEIRTIKNGDAVAAFFAIGLYREKGEPDKALAAIDQLDEAIGGDPYLDVLRSSIYEDKGDKDKAHELAKKGIANLVTPPFPLKYQSLRMGSVSEFRFEEMHDGSGRAIVWPELSFPHNNEPSKVYVYLPAGQHDVASLPCVFIAASGGTFCSGMPLSDADQPEFLPYVKAGFAVVGYETPGEVPGDASIKKAQEGFDRYRRSFAGLSNAATAVELAVRDIPQIDANRFYTAGHSSAGKQAFLLAAHEPRIKGCISYNGVLSHEERAVAYAEYLYLMPPDCLALIQATSPSEHLANIKCPVFLFHTRDDEYVPVELSIECEQRLKELGADVTLLLDSGGHYQGMLDKGIPAGIEWLTALDKQINAAQ